MRQISGLFRKVKRRRETVKIYKEGNGMYGHCWIEGDGYSYWVCVLGGKSKYGPFSSLEDAIKEYHRWCLG